MNMMAPADGPVSFPGRQQEECCFDKLSLPDAGDLLAWQVAPVGNLTQLGQIYQNDIQD